MCTAWRTRSPRAWRNRYSASSRGHGLRRQWTGEAREADLGVASGNGKGQIFVKGQVIKTVPEAMIVETLIEEALRIADSASDGATRPATVANQYELRDTARRKANAA